MPQRKRRSAGSTLKGNIHSRPEEKGAEESRRRLAAGRRPAPGAVRSGQCGAAQPKTRTEVAAAARRWRKWSGEEGVVVSVWRRRRESFLQLHFRSAFCSERERRNERDTHTGLLPPPPSPPPSVGIPTHPTPPSRREGRPRRLEDWFPGRRRCPPGSSGPRSGVCECFYVGEGGGGGRRSSDLSSRLVSPRLYMFPALRRRKRSRSHPPSRPGL